jgi:molybdopterin molybdotransferase
MVKQDSPSLQEALTLALERTPRKKEREIVMLDRALGRVTAEEIRAARNLPPFDNSAMDGFALRHGEAGRRLRIAATIYAGDRPRAVLKPGECYRIMTGAKVPEDADAVVPIEACSDVTEAAVTVPGAIAPESNLRRRGEEVAAGETLIAAGTRLEPSHIALLGSQGIMSVAVRSPLRIAVLSTGNELREPWERADEEEVHNANAFGILSLLRQYGYEAEYHGRIPDDREATERVIAGLKRYDVIVTSGGISMGAADHLYAALLANGMETLFHGVRLKPGHPVTMGTMGGTLVMALPGNPLATMLTLLVLGIPALRARQGDTRPRHTEVLARMGSSLRFRGGRSELVLGKIEEGVFVPTRNYRYGSGMLTPLTESNAVAVVPEGTERLEERERVPVIPLGRG